VRTPTGSVVIDPTGRLPGRGAYLCRDASCWSLAARRRALEHALKTTIPTDLAAILAAGPAGPAVPTREPLTSDEGEAHGQE
jgi:predicted RNA-binding protein YlxR (DUF448 family)